VDTMNLGAVGGLTSLAKTVGVDTGLPEPGVS
jgi:hypothetical protein